MQSIMSGEDSNSNEPKGSLGVASQPSPDYLFIPPPGPTSTTPSRDSARRSISSRLARGARMLAARGVARLRVRAALRDAQGDRALAAILVSRWTASQLLLPQEDEAELQLRLMLSSLPPPATSSARDAPAGGTVPPAPSGVPP